MSFNTITEEIKNSVHILKLNRPDRLNAWTEEMAKEIKESMSNASKNKEVKAIVLTGTGRGFCAGADMDSLNAVDADEREEKSKESPHIVMFSWTKGKGHHHTTKRKVTTPIFE